MSATTIMVPIAIATIIGIEQTQTAAEKKPAEGGL